MGYIRRSRLLKSNKGQSTVEYILLMAVVTSLMTTVWNSRAFKDFLGEDSDFFNGIAEMIRLNFQYAAVVPLGTESSDRPQLNHPSFISNGTTRFFTHGEDSPYPEGN